MPIASPLSSTQADPRFERGAPSTAAKDPFTDIEDALARLVHASYPSDARARDPRPGRSADARISRSSAAATLGAADLRPPIARKQRSRGKRMTFARVAIAVCLGACAIWAWRSHGGPARDTIATPAPPLGAISVRPWADQTPALRTPDRAPEQAAAPPAIEASAPPAAQAAPPAVSIAQRPTTAAPRAASAERQQAKASDLAALRQTVEKLAAGQKQLAREIAKLQVKKPQADKPPAKKPDQRTLRRVSAHPAPLLASARKPAPINPMRLQAARQVSTAIPLLRPPRPAPQIPSETQPPPPLRPPMPVPQP